MNTKAKLLDSIRTNPKGVRFSSACRAAEILGFERKGGVGSHCTFVRSGESALLNFQNHNGLIPPYQAHQLIAMIEKYRTES